MLERALKCVHVVETLAGEIAFTKKVLIDVGDGGSVGIDSGITRENLHKPRTRGTRQRDAHARLQNAVTASHASVVCVDTWLVEGMDCGADEFPRNIARSEEHTSELQSRLHLVCRLLLEKKK